MCYNDSQLAKDHGLPQSCKAAVTLLFVFPDILDFLAAVINNAVEQCESQLETGGACSKYLEIQMMVNSVVTEMQIFVPACVGFPSADLLYSLPWRSTYKAFKN